MLGDISTVVCITHRSLDTPCPDQLLQVPWDKPLASGIRLDSGGPQPSKETAEVGVAVQGVDQGGCRCLDIGEDLCGSAASGHDIRVVDVVNDKLSWDSFGRIPPQGGPQADGETN